MQDKFIVPEATMVAGIVVWVVFVILRMVLRKRAPWSPRVDVGACAAAGGLVVFSGFS